MKKWITECNAFLVVSTIIGLYAGVFCGTNAYCFLSNTESVLYPSEIFEILLNNLMARKLSVLCCVLFIATVFYWYFAKPRLFKSEDVEIIPGLFLPKREDRGEYGRSWFIEKKDFDKYFGEIHIPPRLYKQYLKKKKIDE